MADTASANTALTYWATGTLGCPSGLAKVSLSFHQHWHLLSLCSFWFPRVEFASSKAAKLCPCHQSQWEKGERVPSLETCRSHLVVVLGTWPWVALLERGGWSRWPPEAPYNINTQQRSFTLCRSVGPSLPSGCYKSEQATSRSGRAHCSSAAEHFLGLSLNLLTGSPPEEHYCGPFCEH